MRKLLTFVAMAAVAGLMLTSTPQRADAQKQYMEGFVERYSALEEQVEEKKCGVCHGRSKRMRSDYAMALEEALGEKKVKDPEKIMAALEEVEKIEYEDGMTYKDLLDAGHLPAPYSEDE
jgi:hypothetical protein